VKVDPPILPMPVPHYISGNTALTPLEVAILSCPKRRFLTLYSAPPDIFIGTPGSVNQRRREAAVEKANSDARGAGETKRKERRRP
jgi:hypothetical protein